MKPEILNAETNLNGKKTRAASVPKDGTRITEGALKLPLRERVALRDKLTSSIDNEITQMGEDYNAAKTLVNPK